MRMTTKLVSLLTILFVFFKFGKPAQVMMSIYGDKGFFFDSQSLTASQVVGFVYEDANGAFAVVNCSDTVVSSFTRKTDCTVVTEALTITPATSAVTAAEASLKLETAENFPASSVNTNMMVAQPETTYPIVITTKTGLSGSSNVLTIATIAGSGTTALQSASNFLCNHLDATTSNAIFAVDTDTSSFGAIKGVSSEAAKYLPIMKCVGAVRDATKATTAFATFILIVRDHDDISGYLNTIAFYSVVLLPQSIKQPTNTSSVVGYINGLDSCSSNANVTFQNPSTSSTPSCKGTISINTSGNYSFSYNGTSYYLPLTDASGATTCPATTTTTCEDFALNFQYSNTLIGMLLIFMLKMLQNY